VKIAKSPNTKLRDENTSAVPPTLMPLILKQASSLVSYNELIRELLTLVMRCTSWFLGRVAPLPTLCHHLPSLFSFIPVPILY